MSDYELLLNTLRDSGLTLGSVESVTGGLFASRICEIPGASDVFIGGLVTYSPFAKTRLAFVNEETISRYGLVSPEVASSLASGGKQAIAADIVVSCTGNAGPSVQSGDPTVGKVFLGLCFRGSVWTIPLQLSGERNEIREEAARMMANFVLSLFPKNVNENQ
ncbi:MAG: CinA family protein [Bacilli bacterium]|nr:CinA family protein [Bacilli bacterium]